MTKKMNAPDNLKWEDYGSYSTTGSGEGYSNKLDATFKPSATASQCPCGEETNIPDRMAGCICGNPLMVYIPPGGHIHIQCPLHGDVKIYGGGYVWM